MNTQSAQRQLLKSTGIIGGSQLMIMVLNVIKTKIFSFLLGPEGIGLIGLLTSLLDLVRSTSSLGLHVSGIRYIADRTVNGSQRQKEREIYVFRQWVLLSAVLGAVICFLCAAPLCRFVFESEDQAATVRILSICVFLTAISGGQAATLQAMKQVGALAMTNLTATFFTFLSTILIAYLYGMNGVIGIFLCTALFLCISGRYYLRQAYTPSVETRLAFREWFRRGVPMVRLGLLTMLTGLATYGSLFLVKGYITRQSGLETAGVFQAAWQVSALYLGMLLNAMGTDLYPRLSEVNRDRKALSALVDSQLHLGILLVGPLLAALLAFAPLAIRILYSDSFLDAVPLLRWLMLAFFLRSISWTMSYVLMAKAMSKPFLFIELLWYLIYLPLAWLLYPSKGIEGVGIASLIAFSVYTILLFGMMSRIGCRLSVRTIRLGIAYGVMMAAVFLLNLWVEGWPAIVLNGLMVGAGACYSLSSISRIVDLRTLFDKFIRKFKR